MIYGTKAGHDSAHYIKPRAISEVWQIIIDDLGPEHFTKPLPGNTFRKRYNPLVSMDMPSFRRLPSDIKVVSPPRLYRTRAWSYKGHFYMDCETHWQIECEFLYGGEFRRTWLPPYVISNAYQPSTCVPMKRTSQLQLF